MLEAQDCLDLLVSLVLPVHLAQLDLLAFAVPVD